MRRDVLEVSAPDPALASAAVFSAALPLAEQATVSGGHLISPTHPVVADYLGRLLGTDS